MIQSVLLMVSEKLASKATSDGQLLHGEIYLEYYRILPAPFLGVKKTPFLRLPTKVRMAISKNPVYVNCKRGVESRKTNSNQYLDIKRYLIDSHIKNLYLNRGYEKTRVAQDCSERNILGHNESRDLSANIEKLENPEE